MASKKIALIDFSGGLMIPGFYSADPAQKQAVVDQIRSSCLDNGFFQIAGHSIPAEHQKAVMAAVKQFFALPQKDKDSVSKNNNTWNRGYERLRSQMLEEGTEPELKEGFYIGDEIPETHPYFVHRRLNSGPNQWPAALPDLETFKADSMRYYAAALALARDLLRALALSMDLAEDYFEPFMTGAVATLRYLHYPSQPPDADDKLARGIGAHTDFGAITLLLQDTVDGLQVLDAATQTWIDVEPTPGALVVNLGNLMQRWTNERYRSNVHRVINKSGRERFSIPFFVSGNPDYVVDCIPTCLQPGDAPKFPPITVEAAVSAAYAESYGRAQLFKNRTMAQKDSGPSAPASRAIAA